MDICYKERKIMLKDIKYWCDNYENEYEMEQYCKNKCKCNFLTHCSVGIEITEAYKNNPKYTITLAAAIDRNNLYLETEYENMFNFTHKGE